MKKFVIVNGAPGIGKTSTCRALQQLLDKSVWLDGDWCWMANPWIVTEETKKMAENNMVYLLGNFLKCSEYQFVLYSWIFRTDEIFSLILDRLTSTDFILYKYTLTCDENCFRERLVRAGRDERMMSSYIKSLHQCEKTDSEKIDTANKSIETVAQLLYEKITKN